MKKLVKESLNESVTNSFGEQLALQLVRKYLPYLSVEYWDEGDRQNDQVSYGHDEEYEKWDFLMVETGDEEIDEMGLSLLLYKDFDDDEIKIKFYSDAIAYIPGDSNDEYTETLEGVPITEFTEEDFQQIISQLKDEDY